MGLWIRGIRVIRGMEAKAAGTAHGWVESWELTPLITSRESKLEMGQSLPSVTVSSGRLLHLLNLSKLELTGDQTYKSLSP